MDIDPYKMLGIPKIFTPDQLKTAYKKMALVMHPDRQGGNDYMFKMLTTCYKQLVKEYNKRIHDKQFTELKTASQHHMQQPTSQYVPIDDPKKSFNINKFNKIFEDNQIPDAHKDTGYIDWLKTGDDNKSAPKFKGKFTADAFNQQFEKNTPEISKHLVKYKEPEPMFAGKKIQYTELGIDKVDDFSADNLSKKQLNYMDLKIAHTTSRIVDPKTVGERKIFKNINDIEADRANVQYHMSDKEMESYQKKKKLEELREKQRVNNMTAYDQRTYDQFERVNRLMLGGR
jgi:curved DNA-binding protein CbpA